MARGRLVPLGVAGLVSALAAFVVVGLWGPTVEVETPAPVVLPKPEVVVPAALPPAPAPVERPEPVSEPPTEEETLKQAFRKVTTTHAASMHRCYEEAVEAYPGAFGQVELQVWIEGGRITEIEVPGGTRAHFVYTDCLVEEAASWDLSQLPDGKLVWPMVFQPPGGW